MKRVEKSPRGSGPHLRTRFLAHLCVRNYPPFLNFTRARARGVGEVLVGLGGCFWGVVGGC